MRNCQNKYEHTELELSRIGQRLHNSDFEENML